MRLLLLLLFVLPAAVYSQLPKLEPGVSEELAKWRSVQYSNISYKLNLTLEKMSPVLRGHMEIHVTQAASACAEPNCPQLALILDWRKLAGHESDSTLSNVTLNGSPLVGHDGRPYYIAGQRMYWTENEHLIFDEGVRMGENVITLDFTSPILTSGSAITRYIDKEDGSEYLYSLFVPSDASTAFPVFDQPDLKARFETQFILPESWRVVSNTQSIPFASIDYVDIPGVQQPEHQKSLLCPETKPISTYVFAFAAGPWTQVSEPGTVVTGSVRKVNTGFVCPPDTTCDPIVTAADIEKLPTQPTTSWGATNPVTTVSGSDTRATIDRDPNPSDTNYHVLTSAEIDRLPNDPLPLHIYVRRSQAAKFQPHAAETFRLTREAIKYLETYFDYKFPWPKYDLVLIPEFPFGGMEHAGATFLKESSVIFPTEPTRGDEISRANVIFHETAHQWFGDLVTMRWFDDLWLKEGFAEFMAYKTLEHVMPDANAWKVFYERNKQAAYATDSTRGTTPIYQPISNLSAAKSAYGNIVYRKAPSFLRQAEFYLGPDKFQTAVRAFLKKHEYANAGWEDLVGEFETARNDKPKTYAEERDQIDRSIAGAHLQEWAKQWVTVAGVPVIRTTDLRGGIGCFGYGFTQKTVTGSNGAWAERFKPLVRFANGNHWDASFTLAPPVTGQSFCDVVRNADPVFLFPNYGDYGYGIFLLDDKSRDHVLKHIGEEKDPFLRSMMWGALWDSVREAELDPREYVELVIRQLGGGRSTTPPAKPGSPPNQGGESKIAEARASARAVANLGTTETDETTIQSLLGRVSVALNYYLPASDTALPHGRASATADLRSQFETVLLDRMQHAETPGQRITFYRAFVTNATTEHSRSVLKQMLREGGNPSVSTGAQRSSDSTLRTLPNGRVSASGPGMALRTKDRFDIVTRLAILGDPDAPKLLADLEKTETSDDVKRYAYAAHAAFATAENRAKLWNDFISNKDISESWIEAAIVPYNSIRHPELSQPYLARALAELPNLKRTRKIFFINNWLSAWLGGQRDQAALDIVNKFLADNPKLDNDLRLKVLENIDVIERAVKIRAKWNKDVTTK